MYGTPVPSRGTQLASAEKLVSRDWLDERGNFITQEFMRYATPLIQGHVQVPHRKRPPQLHASTENLFPKSARWDKALTAAGVLYETQEIT